MTGSSKLKSVTIPYSVITVFVILAYSPIPQIQDPAKPTCGEIFSLFQAYSRNFRSYLCVARKRVKAKACFVQQLLERLPHKDIENNPHGFGAQIPWLK